VVLAAIDVANEEERKPRRFNMTIWPLRKNCFVKTRHSNTAAASGQRQSASRPCSRKLNDQEEAKNAENGG